MDTLKGIEKLAHEARKEKIPVFDVAREVVRHIRSERTGKVSFMPFEIFAGVSAAVASGILFLAVNAWLYYTSPIMELSAPLEEILLW